MKNLLEKSSAFVSRFDKVAELNLALQAGEVDCFIFADGMEPVDDAVAALHVEQVELDGVSGVHICIREEVLATKKEGLRLFDALLSEGLRVVHPIYCKERRRVAGVDT